MNLARITSDLVGTEYELGSKTGALDCFSLIMKYLKFNRVVPSDLFFRGYEISKYATYYSKNPEKMILVAVDYIASLIKEVPIKKVTAGDILFVSVGNSKSLVIAGGNGVIIAATERGGVEALNQEGYTTQRAFRC